MYIYIYIYIYIYLSLSLLLLKNTAPYPHTLVVVSPMRRTLQTVLALFDCDAWPQRTVVLPLAAETSLASRFSAPGIAKRIVANVQQGDHGSTPAALRALFPQVTSRVFINPPALRKG